MPSRARPARRVSDDALLHMEVINEHDADIPSTSPAERSFHHGRSWTRPRVHGTQHKPIKIEAVSTHSFPSGVIADSLLDVTISPTPQKKGGLSGGAIAGILFAILIPLSLIAAFLWFRKHPWPGGGKGRYAAIRPAPISPTNSSGRPQQRRRPSLVPSSKPDVSFVIDKDASSLGGDHQHRQVPVLQTSTGTATIPGTPWGSMFTRRMPAQTIQQEDLGSAADFTFVSSNDGSSGTTDEPTPGVYTRPPRQHQYPPARGSVGGASTIYPYDSVSNLQLAEYRNSLSSVDLIPPPAARRRAASEVERKREEEQRLAALAALEQPGVSDGTGELGDVDTDSLSQRTFSPPPHRSRLDKIPTSAPVMMYPDMVRGNFTH